MITVLIPVYNEQKVIRKTIAEIKKVMATFDNEIITINDGSSDNSARILQSIKGIKVVNHNTNLGYGASLKTGIKEAKGDKILIIDADGTYPIAQIPKLLEHSDEYDMVVGLRDKQNVPFARKPAKAIIGLFANFLVGKKIPDINSGMRIFKRDMALEFFHLYPQGFSFTTTITLAAMTNNYSVKYVPIDYYKRVGKSTMKPWRFFDFLILIMRIILYFRPLRFFVIPGMILMLLGASYGVYQFIAISNLGEMPVLLFLAGMQIFFLGLIADMISKSRGIK